MSATEDELRAERDHWIGEAKYYERLYRSTSERTTKWFRRMKTAEAKVARVEVIADAWDAWDGSPGPDGRTHPDASSPRDRDRLRAALADPETETDRSGDER